MNATVASLCLAAGITAGQPPQVPVLHAPAPVVVAPLPAPPMELCDFARAFVPLPGCYEVVLIHPVTKCPVKVCFTLPPGCPKVHVHKRTLEFDYGRHAVRIHFRLLGGKYTVRYV